MSVRVLPEPQLLFGYGQALERPHLGLSTFGPVDRDLSSRPTGIRFGLVGTPEGVGQARSFLRAIRGPLVPGEGLSHHLWPPFPGFEAVFHCHLPEEPAWMATLDGDALDHSTRIGDAHDRTYAVVNHFLQPMRSLKDRDEKVDLVLCVVPEQVYQSCRPKSTVSALRRTTAPLSKTHRKLLSLGQTDLLDTGALLRREYSVDFRRQLKARAMELDLPIQILRESTLALRDQNTNPNERSLTPLADRAWNLSTALYYKAGGRPWRLAGARQGVSYVGLAFRLDPRKPKSNSAVCAAQMFLENGDGIVFKGEFGPWYSEERGGFHLSKKAAARLLAGVLETYRTLRGPELSEVFLHSRSEFNDDEWEGYSSACPKDVRLTGVRVRPERAGGIKLFRPGTRPVIRGTFWRLSDRAGFLWGSGFVPEVGAYAGGEVPLPLRIDVLRGRADLDAVVSDIFSLTKLNYNACKVGDSQPVTVGFSDAVGEILVANPSTKGAQPQFRYYI